VKVFKGLAEEGKLSVCRWQVKLQDYFTFKALFKCEDACGNLSGDRARASGESASLMAST
jgi:hypothetical protein